MTKSTRKTYKDLILSALDSLSKEISDRKTKNTVFSSTKIGKFLLNKYPSNNPQIFMRNLKRALKKGVEAGYLKQVKRSFAVHNSNSTQPQNVNRISPKAQSPSVESAQHSKRAESFVNIESTIEKNKRKRQQVVQGKRLQHGHCAFSTSPNVSPVKSALLPPVNNNQNAPKTAQEFVFTTTNSSNETGVILPSNGEGITSEYVWQFSTRNFGWVLFDVEASNKVEEVYQGFLANRGDTDVRAVKSGQWEYMVDFMAMKQTNLSHPNHTVRDIRRVRWFPQGTEPFVSEKPAVIALELSTHRSESPAACSLAELPSLEF